VSLSVAAWRCLGFPRAGSRGRWIRGITLLEVLVALSILAVAMGALIKAGTESTRTTAQIQERLLGHWVGQNLLAVYEAGLRSRDPGSWDGRIEQSDRLWLYRVEIDWVQPESLLELPPVLRIDIEVWPESAALTAWRSQVTGYLLP
jgi:general secretion pathway protein I